MPHADIAADLDEPHVLLGAAPGDEVAIAVLVGIAVLVDVGSDDTDITGNSPVCRSRQLVAIVGEPPGAGDAADVAAGFQQVDRVARAEADGAADGTEARSSLTGPGLDVHPFQQFRFDRDAPDVVEERALDLGAVDGDVELRIFQTANVDLLGDTNGAADRDRRRAAEEVTQVVCLRDLDIVAVECGVGQLADHNDGLLSRCSLSAVIRFDVGGSLRQCERRATKRGCGEEARLVSSHDSFPKACLCWPISVRL